MSNAKLAILSLVAEKPRHGYEIEQIIEERGMREWTEIGFSSIYYLLKKLKAEGLVESELIDIQGRGGARRMYQISGEGRKILHTAAIQALSQPKPAYSPLLLGITNLPILSKEEAMNALHAYQEGLTEKIAHLMARSEAQRPLPPHAELLFEYSLTILRAEEGWVKTAVQKLSPTEETNE